MIVARAFLSLIPISWKYSKATFSCSLHPLQINLFSFDFSGATALVAVFDVGSSLIIENGGGPLRGGGGNTEGSVATLVVTVAKTGKATVRNCCTSLN